MRTFHIVSIDFQLGLAVHACFTGCTKIAVRLISRSLLRILFHQDTSAERTDCTVIQDILEQLVTGTIRYGMRNMAIGIQLLFFVQDRHTAQSRFSLFAVQLDIIVVTGKAVIQRNAIHQYIAPCFLLHMHGCKTRSRHATLFEIVIIKESSFTRKNLDYLCS